METQTQAQALEDIVRTYRGEAMRGYAIATLSCWDGELTVTVAQEDLDDWKAREFVFAGYVTESGEVAGFWAECAQFDVKR